MKEISYSEFKKVIRPGDYFLIQADHEWFLAKAKRTLETRNKGDKYEYIRGYYLWSLRKGSSIGTLEDWDTLQPEYNYYSGIYKYSTDKNYPGFWKLFTLTESEIEPFKVFQEKEKQAKEVKKLNENELKGCIKDILKVDITIPELGLGQELIPKKARHKVNTEENTLELMLNTSLPYIGSDSIQLIEKAIEEASKDKKWKLRFMVLAPRTVTIGGFPGAALKLRLFLN